MTLRLAYFLLIASTLGCSRIIFKEDFIMKKRVGSISILKKAVKAMMAHPQL